MERVKVEAKTEVKVTPYCKVEYRDCYDLDYYRSLMMHAQLDSLCEHFHIPDAISMKALGRKVLPREVHEDLNKISFLLITLECRVRLLLALFVSWLLSELLLHPLQVSLS